MCSTPMVMLDQPYPVAALLLHWKHDVVVISHALIVGCMPLLQSSPGF